MDHHLRPHTTAIHNLCQLQTFPQANNKHSFHQPNSDPGCRACTERSHAKQNLTLHTTAQGPSRQACQRSRPNPCSYTERGRILGHHNHTVPTAKSCSPTLQFLEQGPYRTTGLPPSPFLISHQDLAGSKEHFAPLERLQVWVPVLMSHPDKHNIIFVQENDPKSYSRPVSKALSYSPEFIKVPDRDRPEALES